VDVLVLNAGILPKSAPVEDIDPDQVRVEMCSGSEAGSYVRLIDLCITQL